MHSETAFTQGQSIKGYLNLENDFDVQNQKIMFSRQNSAIQNSLLTRQEANNCQNQEPDFSTAENSSEDEARIEFNSQNFINLHKKYGNQWSCMTAHFQQKNVTFFKNHFYSLLRKVFRKINTYLKCHYRISKEVQKTLQLSFIFKLTNLADTQRMTTPSQYFFRNILYKILDLHDKEVECIEDSQVLEDLLEIQDVYLKNKLRRVGRSKKPTKKEILKKISENKISLFMDQLNQNKKIEEENTIEDKLHNLEKNMQVLDEKLNRSLNVSRTELQVEEIIEAKNIDQVKMMEIEEPMFDLLKDYDFVCSIDSPKDFDPCLFW